MDAVRAVIIGGGGFRVPLVHRALRAAQLPLDELVLYDVDEDRLAVIAAVLAAAGGPPRITTTTDLDTALTDAALVFSATRVGGVDGRVADERRALDLGVLGQETVGAGGLLSALRAVPAAMRVAERIKAVSPQAWLITMTNPAGIVTEAVSRVLGDRVIGVCDSPSGLVRRVREALAVTGPAVPDYIGLNHLGWLRALTVAGVDRLPDLLADPAALASFEEGRLFGAQVLPALGAVPNEYLYYFYAADRALAAVRDAPQTRGEHVRTEQATFYARAAAEPARAADLWAAADAERNASYFAELRDPGAARDAADVAGGGYEGIAAALALSLTGTGPPADLILDAAGSGATLDLPADSVVEVRCRVDPSGAHPYPVAPLTLHQRGLLSTVKACERAIIDAAVTGRRDAAVRAFALHPLVGATAAPALADAGLADRAAVIART